MRYAFADCVLDTDSQTLVRGGRQLPVEPQVFDLLRLLVSNPGRLVTRDEIVDVVWGGRIVSDSAISARIAAARKAVGDDGKAQRLIRTVARRGLRFEGKVAAEERTDPIRSTASSHALPNLRFAHADDGTRLAFTVTGNGPLLAYVDFFPSDTLAAWDVPSERPLIDALNARFTVLRFDQRGCGMSERQVEGLDLETVARDLCVVADAAGFGQFGVLAQSGACLTAVTFAARYPERVKHMVLVGGYAEGRLRRRDQAAVQGEVFHTMIREGWDEPGGAFIAALMAAYMPEGPSEMVQACAAYMQKNTSTRNQLMDRDMINSASVAHCLAQVAAPTLVINARHDPVHPLEQGRKLAAGLPNSEFVVYDTANHVPIPGHRLWDRYVEDVIDFLSRG